MKDMDIHRVENVVEDSKLVSVTGLSSYLVGASRGDCFDSSGERDERNLVGSPRIDTEAEVACTEGGASEMTLLTAANQTSHLHRSPNNIIYEMPVGVNA